MQVLDTEFCRAVRFPSANEALGDLCIDLRSIRDEALELKRN